MRAYCDSIGPLCEFETLVSDWRAAVSLLALTCDLQRTSIFSPTMKLLIACVVAAAAGAVAPPKISLDLAKGSLVRTLKGAVPHPEGLLQPDGTPVTSRQDWSEECAASTATSEVVLQI